MNYTRVWRVFMSGVVLSVVLNQAQAAAPKYRITPINLPPTWSRDVDFADGIDINNAGTVTGSIIVLGGGYGHAFRFRESDGTIDLHPNFDGRAYAYALNGKGDIVGWEEQNGIFLFTNNHLVYISSDQYFLQDAFDINGKGQIIGGGSQLPNYNWIFYLWQNGVTTPLPNGPFRDTSPVAINEDGQILGTGVTTGGKAHPFVYVNGVFTDLFPQGSTFEQGYGIEIGGNGVVTGQVETQTGTHAFLYKDGVLKDLGTFGGRNSIPADVNSSGLVVGAADVVGDPENPDDHAFLYDGISMRDIGPVTNARSKANDITQNGQVCGVYYLSDTSGRAFIYGVDGTKSHNLNALVSANDPSKSFVTLSEAIVMNEFGQIVARGSDTRKRSRKSFLISPIDSTPPVIAPTLTGIKGLGVWYTSAVDAKWTITDAQAPIGSKQGCDATAISADTKGKKVTCMAASMGGSASKTITIKRDATAPTIAIVRPAPGAIFNRDQVVTASYSCADVTSGVKSCLGPVANGVRIDTSKKVTQAQFRVVSTDNAGLQRVLTTTFSVK